MGSKEVAETCFAFLHMELVRMALGGDTASISTPELQQAGRKVEAVGFQVGQRLIERYTKDRPRFSDTLEKIKFICKDFWFEIYRKQIDKLKTNNRVRAFASPRQGIKYGEAAVSAARGNPWEIGRKSEHDGHQKPSVPRL